MRTRALIALTTATLAAGSLAVAPVASAEVTIVGSDTTRTLSCNNDDLVVAGSDNALVLTSNCKRVRISGSDNTITLRDAGRLEIVGSGNAVTLGATPAVEISGSDNSIRCASGGKAKVRTAGVGNAISC
ncbi:DUF3060 domain-containing protein [Tsukamurella strandjordii]|uniref:DUF3060 domain-containing protein n=1 Tax=Tsukamurella TaxID=2060 RepID=UPI001C7D0C88|nr:DUF3060 domain-containing protein [Tsukamurella sp. TY48]GIZ96082.1 hypothetical protein TTY48_06940 [Tsukamurella sp. TY48]